MQLIATEEQEQVAFFNRVKFYPWINQHLLAIPNGGLRNKIIAMKLKAQGVKKGVSDIFFAYPYGDYAGLWIELKRKNATEKNLTYEQIQWLRLMCDAGYMAKMACGADHAWQILSDYLVGKCNYDKWYDKPKKDKQIIGSTTNY